MLVLSGCRTRSFLYNPAYLYTVNPQLSTLFRFPTLLHLLKGSLTNQSGK